MVVFPELALTTFFPRYWMTEKEAIDRYFEKSMPGPETQILFDTAKKLNIGFYLGYAEVSMKSMREQMQKLGMDLDEMMAML